MKQNKIFNCTKTALIVVAMSILAACNKELPVAVPIVVTPPSGATIFETIRANGNLYSYLDSAIVRASSFNSPAGKLDALLSSKNTVITFFAPDNNAFQQSLQLLGLPTSVSSIKFFSPGKLDTIIRYHLIGGQKISTGSAPAVFPNNRYLQSMLVLSAPSPTLPPGYRMPLFPGKTGSLSVVNNIPVIEADKDVANGIMHRIAFVLLPPQQTLWDRINSDPDLEYLKAAVKRADGNTPVPGSLQSALMNPAANLTVMAPSDLAFQQLLTAQITQALIPIITQQLIAGGSTPDDAAAQAPALALAQATALASTPDVFTNPALAGVLTPQTVSGLVVYHLLAEKIGSKFQGIRAFSFNIPTTETNSYTLLNSAVALHPGVTLKAIFGSFGISQITVKGVANSTASNVAINPTPAPLGTSDQHYINGTLHKIDQVLRPQ